MYCWQVRARGGGALHEKGKTISIILATGSAALLAAAWAGPTCHTKNEQATLLPFTQLRSILMLRLLVYGYEREIIDRYRQITAVLF